MTPLTNGRRPFRPRSIRTRLAFSHAVALVVALAAYSLALYFFFQRGLLADLDIKLRNDLEAADDALAPSADAGTIARDAENWLTEAWTPSGKRLYSSGASDDFPLGQLDPKCADRRVAFNAESPDGVTLRAFCQQSSFQRGESILRVARVRGRIEEQLTVFRSVIFVGMPAVVLLSILLGYWLAKRALLPVAQITAAARRISASRLSERLPVANPDDEFGALAQAFNEVFAGLERSFHQMRRFTADASHELRTPLTAIRALGEVALGRRSGGRDLHEAVENILEESGRLQSLCDSLLLLSRADAGQIALALGRVDIGKLTRDVIEFLGILAEEKGQTIDLRAPFPAFARVDSKIVKHALSNLIDNAIKYSPNGAKIAVTATADQKIVRVAVTDNGAGIPAEQHELIFQRFYRADESRARREGGPGGAGLGLSIALWAVELHGGTIRIESAVGKGSTFTIEVPMAGPDAADKESLDGR